MPSMRSVLFRVAETVSLLRRALRDTEQHRRCSTSSADKVSVELMSIEAFRKSIWLLKLTSVRQGLYRPCDDRSMAGRSCG